MDFDEFKSALLSHYEQLSQMEYSESNFRESCKDFFDNWSQLSLTKTEINELIDFTIGKLRMTNLEISEKFDENLTPKILTLQTIFFFSFYSFLFSKFNFEFDDTSQEEFVSWAVDIISSLSIFMDSGNWKIFMNSLVLSFHDTLQPVLFDIHEILGLDISPEIAPEDYKPDTFDISSLHIETKVVKSKKREQVVSIDLVENEEIHDKRGIFHYDMPINHVNMMVTRNKSKTLKSETSRRKSNTSDKKKERKCSTPRNKKRRSLVPETPNSKETIIDPYERIIRAAQRKLNGKIRTPLTSPVFDRTTPVTPTSLQKFRRANILTDKRIKNLSTPTSLGEKWVRQLEEEERSLSQFSGADSNDFLKENLSKPIKRFKSLILDYPDSPMKSPKKFTPKKDQSKLFSPQKSCLKSNEKSSKSPIVKLSFNLFSPRKTQKNSSTISSPSITVIETNNRTPLKSCLKSPGASNKQPPRRPLKRRSNMNDSVLLSPKIKQRLFVPSEPPSNLCEETMFMDSADYKACLLNQSPLLPVFHDDTSNSSKSSINVPRTITTRRSTASTRSLNFQKKLFGNTPSDISASNILPANSRRSTVLGLNLVDLDPETDISNSLKF